MSVSLRSSRETHIHTVDPPSGLDGKFRDVSQLYANIKMFAIEILSIYFRWSVIQAYNYFPNDRTCLYVRLAETKVCAHVYK